MFRKLFLWIFLGFILLALLFFFQNRVNSNVVLNNSIDLILPDSVNNESKKSFKVEINKEGEFLIQDRIVERDSLEKEIIKLSKEGNFKTIIIKSHTDIEMKHVVYIMDIANRNKIKSILAVKSK